MSDGDVPPLLQALQTALDPANGLTTTQQLALVAAQLDAGADPNTTVELPDSAGRIPVLYFPSAAGHAPLTRLLLERGAAPTDGESVHHAAQHDHREVLALLLEFGADLSDTPDQAGSTPLHFLASHRVGNPLGGPAMRGLTWLLEHGADPNVPLRRAGDGQRTAQIGETPLMRAAASGHGADIIERLLAHGAQVNATRADGRTAYTLAVRHGNVVAAHALERAGADTTRVTTTDRLLAACRANDGHTARALVAEHPALLATLDEEARGALHDVLYDMLHHDTAATGFELMLSLGWPLDAEGEWGGTALHWAAWHGRESVVRQLLQHGAPVNARDSRYGSAPVAWAAHGSTFGPGTSDEASYARVASALLDAGATRDAAINRWQEPPESFAAPAVRALFVSRGFMA